MFCETNGSLAVFGDCSQINEVLITGLDNVPITMNNLASDAIIYCYEYSAMDFWASENGFSVQKGNLIYLDDYPVAEYCLKNKNWNMFRGETMNGFSPGAGVFFKPNEISLTSSNTDVATVDSAGNVTAVGAGTARITLTIKGQSAFCDISVRVKTVAFSLSASRSEILCGETLDVSTDALIPQDADTAFTWSVSGGLTLEVAEDTRSAKINAWQAAALGTYILTVSGDGVEKQCEITLKALNDFTVTGIPTQKIYGNRSFILTVLSDPENVDMTFVWQNNNPSVASIQVSTLP